MEQELIDKEACTKRLLYFLSLGNSADDVILEEMIDAIGQMDAALSNVYLQDVKRIAILRNKVDLLLTIQKLIERRAQQGTHQQVFAVVAMFVKHLQDVLVESGIPKDMMKVLVSNLINRVEESQVEHPILQTSKSSSKRL